MRRVTGGENGMVSMARSRPAGGVLFMEKEVSFRVVGCAACRGTSLMRNIGRLRPYTGSMVVLGGGAVSYERGTPLACAVRGGKSVCPPEGRDCHSAHLLPVCPASSQVSGFRVSLENLRFQGSRSQVSGIRIPRFRGSGVRSNCLSSFKVVGVSAGVPGGGYRSGCEHVKC